MPRLPHSLIHSALSKSQHLHTLLRECRTLSQATAELRWLREFAIQRGYNRAKLQQLCLRRGRGEPLQYILGTQPFGGLEILCKRGVLIPRPETEHLASHLASRLVSHLSFLPPGIREPLRILDLCTGSGCIPLHLYTLLTAADVQSRCLGIDVSVAAVTLARANVAHNIRAGTAPTSANKNVMFRRGDLLVPEFSLGKIRRYFGGRLWRGKVGAEKVDIVVANPPYVSLRGYEVETARSVRNYEPRLALVPRDGGDADAFYPAVVGIAERLDARVVVVEVGGWEQAERVKVSWEERGAWKGVAIWPDYAGKGRGVVAWKDGWEWVGESPTTEWSNIG